MAGVPRRHGLTAALVVAVVAGMTGLAFAAPPLYRLFCQVTGYGGTTQRAEAASSRVLDRQIAVRFDTNVAPGVPIRFRAAELTQTLRIGETGVAFFDVENTSDRPVRIVATFNVAPYVSGPYFRKLQCFCFDERELAPGEQARLPVIYYVDPEIVDDPDTAGLSEITLSYTYFAAPEGGRA